MATALSALRAKLNYELGVDTDAETAPWSQAQRNSAISDGYAALWTHGVWKPLNQTVTTIDDTWAYALTSIREIWRLEFLDSSGFISDVLPASVQDDGSGGYQLVLSTPSPGGYSVTVRGWGAYTSTFANDSAVDDLPAEYNRIPLLKAKAILYRAQLSRFARYGERQSVDPQMNVSVDQIIGMIAAAEQEFTAEAKKVAARRPHVMRPTTTVIPY